MLNEEERVNWIINWIFRMSKKHGGIVFDKNGKIWDWGQALCRECYGENWINERLPESPTIESVKRAQQWEAGDIPSWVDNN